MVEETRTKAELKAYLKSKGVDAEDVSTYEIAERGWTIETNEGTLGGWHLEAYQGPEGATFSTIITKDKDGSDDHGDGESHAAMSLLAMIVELEETKSSA